MGYEHLALQDLIVSNRCSITYSMPHEMELHRSLAHTQGSAPLSPFKRAHAAKHTHTIPVLYAIVEHLYTH